VSNIDSEQHGPEDGFPKSTKALGTQACRPIVWEARFGPAATKGTWNRERQAKFSSIPWLENYRKSIESLYAIVIKVIIQYFVYFTKGNPHTGHSEAGFFSAPSLQTTKPSEPDN
jgi:hypothetical protein